MKTVIYRGAVYYNTALKAYTIQVDEWIGDGFGWNPVLGLPLPERELQAAIDRAAHAGAVLIDRIRAETGQVVTFSGVHCDNGSILRSH